MTSRSERPSGAEHARDSHKDAPLVEAGNASSVETGTDPETRETPPPSYLERAAQSVGRAVRGMADALGRFAQRLSGAAQEQEGVEPHAESHATAQSAEARPDAASREGEAQMIEAAKAMEGAIGNYADGARTAEQAREEAHRRAEQSWNKALDTVFARVGRGIVAADALSLQILVESGAPWSTDMQRYFSLLAVQHRVIREGKSHLLDTYQPKVEAMQARLPDDDRAFVDAHTAAIDEESHVLEVLDADMHLLGRTLAALRLEVDRGADHLRPLLETAQGHAAYVRRFLGGDAPRVPDDVDRPDRSAHEGGRYENTDEDREGPWRELVEGVVERAARQIIDAEAVDKALRSVDDGEDWSSDMHRFRAHLDRIGSLARQGKEIPRAMLDEKTAMIEALSADQVQTVEQYMRAGQSKDTAEQRLADDVRSLAAAIENMEREITDEGTVELAPLVAQARRNAAHLVRMAEERGVTLPMDFRLQYEPDESDRSDAGNTNSAA